MLFFGFISWWYGSGWVQVVQGSMHRLARTGGFFSIGLILRTLFAPYRQISAGAVRGGIGIQLRAFLDRLVSRFVGFFVRFFVLIAGIICILGLLLIRGIWILLWPLLPVLPAVAIILTVMGVTVI